MPGGLPPVLITNTDTITEEIEHDERVQVEDVARLWRVYTLNSAHIEDDEGTRLENFFWRIWSNRNIMTAIRGNTLARLFITISEGGNRVRTTPVPTPLATTPTQYSTLLSAAPMQLSAAPVSLQKNEHYSVSPGTLVPGAPPRRISDQSKALPPILKKSRTGSSEPPKSAKILPPDTADRRSSTSTTRRQSSESSGALSSPSMPSEKGSKNAAKKRTSFTAPGGTRKARPGAMRKRSGQTSASGEQRKSSQTSPSLAAQPSKTTPKSAMGLPPILNTANFALPSSSWQDVDSPSSRTSLETTFSTPQQPSSWLVDKNFRHKFVEHQKRANSSINLAALGKSQSVRFLDEMPEYKKTAGKGKVQAKAAGSEEGPNRSPPASASEAIEEEESSSDDESDDESDDDDMPALPRTKSQLSMLIDKERKYSGGMNLGPEASRQETRAARNSKGKGNDDEEENELLVMARRDKKGRPEDPDHPFKEAARKGFLVGAGGGGGSSDGEGSRSPPPVF